jgi:hypothetical protein
MLFDTGLVSIPLPMYFVSGAVTGLGGITTRHQISRKSTKKVRLFLCAHLWSPPTLKNIGKYLLERERLVKDNAWTLEG